MLQMAPRVWRYHMVIAYYHCNGYWLGMLRGLVGRRVRSKWVWVRRATGHRDDPAAVRGGRGPDGVCPLGRRNGRKLLIVMPGGTGSKPVTPALRGQCSTAELKEGLIYR